MDIKPVWTRGFYTTNDKGILLNSISQENNIMLSSALLDLLQDDINRTSQYSGSAQAYVEVSRWFIDTFDTNTGEEGEEEHGISLVIPSGWGKDDISDYLYDQFGADMITYRQVGTYYHVVLADFDYAIRFQYAD